MTPNSWLIYHDPNPQLDFSLPHSLIVGLSLSHSFLLITLLVVLRCWSSCKIWFKILSCCEIVDIIID